MSRESRLPSVESIKGLISPSIGYHMRFNAYFIKKVECPNFIYGVVDVFAIYIFFRKKKACPCYSLNQMVSY